MVVGYGTAIDDIRIKRWGSLNQKSWKLEKASRRRDSGCKWKDEVVVIWNPPAIYGSPPAQKLGEKGTAGSVDFQTG